MGFLGAPDDSLPKVRNIWHMEERKAPAEVAVLAQAFQGGAIAFGANPQMKEYTDVLDFKKFAAPATWMRGTENSNIGQRTKITFQPSMQSDLEISAYYRGLPIGEKSGQAFHDLIAANSNLNAPRVLFAEKLDPVGTTLAPSAAEAELLKSLTDVMGISTTGDNQITNPHKPPHPYAPAFHVESVQLRPVNGTSVLEVEGAFVDDQGKPRNYYKGVFLDFDRTTGRHIHQVFLQGSDKTAFTQNNVSYEASVNSLVW
ncbi:MAG: hypothetical protein HS132_15740 [Planctomycetia bacterium]|nr:hypothetical protein [Planctomycetia bacterium]